MPVKKGQKGVEQEMAKFKAGTLHSGSASPLDQAGIAALGYLDDNADRARSLANYIEVYNARS